MSVNGQVRGTRKRTLSVSSAGGSLNCHAMSVPRLCAERSPRSIRIPNEQQRPRIPLFCELSIDRSRPLRISCLILMAGCVSKETSACFFVIEPQMFDPSVAPLLVLSQRLTELASVFVSPEDVPVVCVENRNVSTKTSPQIVRGAFCTLGYKYSKAFGAETSGKVCPRFATPLRESWEMIVHHPLRLLR